MASFNKVILVGNICCPPELRYIPNGVAVCTLSLAVNRKYKQGDTWKDEVCFVDITVWGKTGENCNEYLDKGSPVLVEGYLKLDTWEDSGGQKRSKLKVVATNVQFLARKSEGQSKDTGNSHGTEF